MFFNGGPIVWSSKRQPCVAVSSSEAEYYAASLAGLDVMYYRRLLAELGHTQPSPTIVHEDNMACIYLSRKDGQINRAKHIDTRVHRLRELVRDGIMTLVKIATSDQIADAFTKGLPASAFFKHRASFMSSKRM